MKTIALDVLLVAVALACWLSVLAFFRLHSLLDRLHCITFLNVVGGTALLGAALVQDGASSRVLKIALILLLNLLGGAVQSHVTGRALWQRGINT